MFDAGLAKLPPCGSDRNKSSNQCVIVATIVVPRITPKTVPYLVTL